MFISAGSFLERHLVVALAVVLTVGAGASYAVAQPAAQQSKTVYACVTKGSKTLRQSTKAAKCPRGQKKISFAAQGARGPTGATGPAGPAGPTGARGPEGARGPAGAVGATGPRGEVGATGQAGPGVRTIAGKINADGTVAFGSGYTATRLDTGKYRISFPSGTWGNFPMVTVTPAGVSGAITIPNVSEIGGDGTGAAYVDIWLSSTAPGFTAQNNGFYFVAAQG